jgi:hypothetical protein
MMETLTDGSDHAQSVHRSSSMFIYQYQCVYLSPFEINGKGDISLGMVPLTKLSLRLLPLDALSYWILSMHMMNLSPFEKGYHFDAMLVTCVSTESHLHIAIG